MNYNRVFSLWTLFCLIHYCLGEPGCMDNSWHLKKRYDNKEFHYVTSSDGGYCKCPCSKYIAQYGKQFPRGRCPVCKHFRIPQPIIILDNAYKKYQEYEGKH